MPDPYPPFPNHRLYLYTVFPYTISSLKKTSRLPLLFAAFPSALLLLFRLSRVPSVSLRLIIIYSPSKELSPLASRFGTFFIFVTSFPVTFSIFQSLESLPLFCPVRFGTAKVETFFYFPKLIFFIFLSLGNGPSFSLYLLLNPSLPLFSNPSQNIPLLRLRAAKVCRLLDFANACPRKSTSVLITLCKSAGKILN